MNYDNYEGRIVEIFSVAIRGWPCGKVANPGTIGRDNVYALLEALEGHDGKPPTCYWVKLSDSELDARRMANAARAAQGETVYKPRKKAVRKKAAPKSADVVQSSDEDDDGEDDGEEDGEGDDD